MLFGAGEVQWRAVIFYTFAAAFTYTALRVTIHLRASLRGPVISLPSTSLTSQLSILDRRLSTTMFSSDGSHQLLLEDMLPDSMRREIVRLRTALDTTAGQLKVANNAKTFVTEKAQEFGRQLEQLKRDREMELADLRAKHHEDMDTLAAENRRLQKRNKELEEAGKVQEEMALRAEKERTKAEQFCEQQAHNLKTAKSLLKAKEDQCRTQHRKGALPPVDPKEGETEEVEGYVLLPPAACYFADHVPAHYLMKRFLATSAPNTIPLLAQNASLTAGSATTIVRARIVR